MPLPAGRLMVHVMEHLVNACETSHKTYRGLTYGLAHGTFYGTFIAMYDGVSCDISHGLFYGREPFGNPYTKSRRTSNGPSCKCFMGRPVDPPLL